MACKFQQLFQLKPVTLILCAHRIMIVIIAFPETALQERERINQPVLVSTLCGNHIPQKLKTQCSDLSIKHL